MENSNQTFKNPLRLLLNVVVFIFVIFLIIYIGININSSYEDNTERITMMQNVNNEIKLIAYSVFEFIRPFLQLIIILLILEWLINRFGISTNKNFTSISWNVQTIIALIVIVAFSLAALSGIQGAGMLKDLALVVVGFYFGTQKKTVEINQDDTKITTIDEHINDQNKDLK